jgi:hypothetical protein
MYINPNYMLLSLFGTVQYIRTFFCLFEKIEIHSSFIETT